MGWLDKMPWRKTKQNMVFADMLNGYTPIFSQFGQNIYASDVVQQALMCIVTEMKKLNLTHVITSDEGDTAATGQRSLNHLLQNPNELMTKSEFLEKITWSLLFNYNAFIIPVYDIWTDAKGRVKKNYTALYPVQPNYIEFLQDPAGTLCITLKFANDYVYDIWTDAKGRVKKNYTALYPVQPNYIEFLQDPAGTLCITLKFANDYETTLPYSDVIHWRHNFSVNEFLGGNEQGQPNNEALLKTLELNNTLLQGVSSAMKSSFAINGVVKYNTLMDDGKTVTALKELEKKLLASESGFLPLDLKAEFIPIKKEIKLVDAETLKFIDEKILRNWGISLPILSESGFLPLDLKAEFIPIKKEIKLVDAETLKFIDEKILRNWGISLPILTGDFNKDQYEAFYQKVLEGFIITLGDAFTKTLFSDREKSYGNRIKAYTGDFNKDQYEAFYQKVLEGFIITLGDAFTKTLFSDREKSYGNRIKAYPKDLVFMSVDQTLEMIRLLGDSGALYENEKRVALGLKPLQELNGVRKQSLNYVDVNIANSYQLQNKKTEGEDGN